MQPRSLALTAFNNLGYSAHPDFQPCLVPCDEGKLG